MVWIPLIMVILAPIILWSAITYSCDLDLKGKGDPATFFGIGGLAGMIFAFLLTAAWFLL